MQQPASDNGRPPSIQLVGLEQIAIAESSPMDKGQQK